MTQPDRFDGLEVEEDIRFQRRAWAVQRAGSLLMGLIVLAGLAGLFGHGPLSSATAGSAGSPLRVEYPRFMRFTGDESLRLTIGPAAIRDGQARVSVNRAFIESMDVQTVTPTPERVETGPRGVTFVFNVPEPAGEAPVALHVRPQRVGRLSIEVSADGDGVLRFSTFVFP